MVFIIGGIGLFFVLMVNIYWFKIKDILKNNGFKVRPFSHMNDIGNFQHLINLTEDVELKSNYKKILFRLRLFMILTIIPVIGIVLWMELWYTE